MNASETLSVRSAGRNAHRRNPFAGLLTVLAGLADGWRGYEAFEALNRLDDRALAARGLTRKDLPRVAFEAMQAKA